MKSRGWFLLVGLLAWLVTGGPGSLRAGSPEKDVAKVFGKVQFVTSFPDYRVQVVESFPDLKVQMVTSFPNKPGRWQEVTAFPDFKIQLVDSFPDFKIQWVSSFPGPTR